MTALIQFVANDIRLEGSEVDVALDPQWLDRQLGDARVRGRRGPGQGGRLTGRISRSGIADIVVRCRVRAAVDADCVRCLAPAPFDVDAEISLLLQPSAPVRGAGNGHRGGHRGNSASQRGKTKPGDDDDEYEFSAGEADVDHYDGETVVLDSFVREAIL